MTRAVLGSTHGPFIGLRPFLARDRHLFLGRDEETTALVRAWSRHRLTVLHGDNGVGKTSLVRAGAAPALADRGHTVLATGDLCLDPSFPAAVLPAQNPYTRALLALWSPREFPTHGPGTSVVDFLRTHTTTDRYGRPRPLFAVLDQTELLLRRSAVPEQWRKDFLDELFGALEEEIGEHLHLLVIVRTVHLDEFRRLVDKREIEHAEVALEPFTPDIAHAVVEGSLTRAGSGVGAAEPHRLVEEARTIRAVGDSSLPRTGTIEPALLQLLGLTLWEEPRKDPSTLVPEDHAEIDRALAERLSDVLEEVAAEHLIPADVPRAWLRELVLCGGRSPTGSARGDPHGPPPPRVVHTLEDRHLVTLHDHGSGHVLRHPRLARPLMVAAPPCDVRRPSTWTDGERLSVANGARVRGERALAAEHAERALSSRPSPEPRTRALFAALLGDLAFERGEHRAAAERYAEAARSCAAIGEGAAVSRLLVAEARNRILMGERSAALAILTAVEGRVHGDPSLRTGIAQVLWSAGQARSALDVLDGALVGGGGITEARRTRGEIRAEVRENERRRA